MSKQLSEAQIESLHMFCEFHGVKYYDVHIELVDHLASAIETRWLTEPNVDFEQALNDVYRTFGVGGFSKVRMEKEKELRQKYSRLQRKYIGEFFKLPKIILTFTVGFIMFCLLQMSDNPVQTSRGVVLIYASFLLLFLYVFYPKRLQLNLLQDVQFLLHHNYKTKKWQALIVFISVLNLLALFNNHSDEMTRELSNILLSSSLTFYIIASIVISVNIPQRIKDDFEKEFPQFIKA